ncbi:hypothetical protein MNEG_7306 [Monoraphidium neglectum]|uniref:Uncharacterized protein n=1 Tax=Monoraphidium neglectum TaxID=145388 RepID=A0A0D2KZT3_9CHLO|nr:hypothetical protein MNEG_7306 [Monoraphidium neglectum]KIZ00659.1 hypothetical protein MNEG_7306 [Monoraphidium neglectum]|eukprot:XP_013899678.1 hypothetical protein MNEG_7306 [Monoraphidium neglectum]
MVLRLLSEGCAARLAHLCDAVLSLEPLADDSDVYRLVPDQASAIALLHVRRLPGNSLWRPRPVGEPLFVVRGSRRRGLALTAFEVDPDAAEGRENGGGGGGGSGTGGGKPAAAMLCAGPGGAGKALDF